MRAFRVVCFALVVLPLVASEASGQTGSGTVAVSGRVGGAVFLSVAPEAQTPGGRSSFTHSSLSPQTVRLFVRARGGGRVSVPLRLRSNVAYRLAASADSGGAAVRSLCFEGARPTGRFVAAAAVEAAGAAACGRAAPPELPRTLLKGPPVSLAGGLDSPSNALELLLVVEAEPDAAIELILSATPAID